MTNRHDSGLAHRPPALGNPWFVVDRFLACRIELFALERMVTLRKALGNSPGLVTVGADLYMARS